MRRLAPAVILFLAFVLPGIALAQTCPPPVIMVVGGTNPACTGQPVTLDAGPGWSTYQWAPGGATTRMITDSPGGTMSYTVTTTDANGCSVTSQPMTVVVNAAPAAPAIDLHETTICSGGHGGASVSGTWSSYAWSVTNGTISGGASSSNLNYTASGEGPVGVALTVTDANGCAVAAHADVTLRPVAKPTIQTWPDAICPGSMGNAWINAPAEGGSWSSYHWTVTNGTFANWSNGSEGSIGFISSPSGMPLIVQVTATDTAGCTATSDPITIPVRTIAKPTIQTWPDAICPSSMGNAWINAPAEGGSWSSYHWTVTNGTFASWSNGSEGSIGFISSPSGMPLIVQVTATDTAGCTATSDPITIPVRTIAKPTIQTWPDAICPGSMGNAWINAPAEGGSWSSYHWTVTNGTFASWSNGSEGSIGFISSPSGMPLIVQVTATDSSGCTATSDPITIPVRTIAKPTIQTWPDAICPSSMGNAWINAPAEGGSWSSYHWTVTNGTFASWSNGSEGSIGFISSPSGMPLIVQVTATDGSGCTATSDPVTIPVRVLTPPPISLNSPSVCAGSYVQAQIGSPAFPDGPWASVTWSATNAVRPGIINPNDTTFFGIATGGPVTLLVTVVDNNGCSATSTIEIPVAANPPMAVMTVPEKVCAGSIFTVTAHDPNGIVHDFQFYATNATNHGIEAGGTATFSADGPGPVEIYATSMGADTCAVYGHASTLAVVPPDATITASGPTAICAGGTVMLTAPDGMQSYSWSTGGTTQSITVANAGSYTVTVSNAPGCSTTSAPVNVTIDVPATPAISPGGSTALCTGGSVTLTASAGSTYAWSTGATTQAITVSAAGNYSVTVTDASGCSATSAATAVTMNAPPSAFILAETSAKAGGGATGFGLWCEGTPVILTAKPDGMTYLWSTGETTQTITVNAEANYSVTVTNAGGCPAVAPFHVVYDPTPKPVINPPASTSFCGTIQLTCSNAGSHPVWIRESGGNVGNGNSATVFLSGTYYVLSEFGNGCWRESDRIVLTRLPDPQGSITASVPKLCPGGSVVLTANVSDQNASYLWSTGATTRTINVSSAGFYMVHVTGANSCAIDLSYNVSTDPTPRPVVDSLEPNATACEGGSVTLFSNGGSLPFLWSNGATTPQIVVTTEGDYWVTKTDEYGCALASDPIHVTIKPLPAKPVITPGGPTTFCLNGSVTLTSSPGVSYLWSLTNSFGTGFLPGSPQSISADSTGDYTVQVRGANGCLSPPSDPIHVTGNVPPQAWVTAGGPTTFCSGQSVTLSVTGGTTVLWSTGETTRSIVVTASGNYSATTSDPTGCSTTSPPTSVTVNPLPAAVVTPSGPTSFCAGNGVILDAGQAPNYLWSTGATTRAIFVGSSGSYTVTITGTNGCSATSAPTVVTANALPAASITADGPTTFCPGGSVTLTASAGASYIWSNGATTRSILVNSGGNYHVTVTSADGCTATGAPMSVTVNAAPIASITASGPTSFCAGGSVTLTASNGASYLWSTGATTASIVANASGSFSVTVTDANGCSATSAPTVVTANAIPTAGITAGGPTTFCAGGSVTLTASGGSSYLWSTGATTASIVASTSGNYSVTVTNANGCSATSSPAAVTANANPAASITPSGPTTFCAGGSVTLTASSGSSYLWSTGATTASIVASTTGSYSVTITNANGCSATSAPTAVAVNANPTASITAGGPTTFCAGGSVMLTASSGSSYLWSTGATTASIVASTSGSYSVTVTNANGCSATSSPATVTVNANPTASITPGGPTTFCAGGSVTLTASSGSSYLWSTGATTASIVASTTGSYSVTVTNANGCSTISAPTVITANANPTATITAGGPTTFCAGGSVMLTASSGSSYLWSTGATTASIVASTSGSYSVTVTNANGCSATSSPTTVTVNANPTASITPGGPTTFCAGGSVTLTASTGTSYLWSTGATTSSIVASTTGSYSVTVTNANGCTATSSPAVVTVNTNPTANITAGGPTTFCAGGSVTLTVPAGSSYLWSTGATTSSIIASSTGSYSVTVTNANGCSAASAPTTVTVNANPTATITAGGPTTFCAGGNVTLTASSGSSYLWSTGATTSSIIVGSSGSYSVTVTTNGCSTASAPVAVTVNANPAATITAGGPTTFCAGGNVTLTSSAGSSYLWSTGATTPSITVNSSGNYSVTVTGANGCSATSAPTAVTVNSPATATITPGGPTTFCAGRNVSLSANAGSSYLWSTGATSRSITVNASGSYTVTVTDANGCSSTSAPTATTMYPYLSVTITFDGPNYFCAGGSVTLTAHGGVSYLWDGGQTTNSIVATATGWYGVTATDANGCTGGTAYYVQVNANPATPEVTASGPTTFCAGGSVTLTAPTGFSYLWSNGATTSAISVGNSGSYSVTVTDANGCKATSAPTAVTVNTTVSTITAGGPTTFCSGGSVTLTASSGASYLWSTGATTQSIAASASGNYSVAVTGANGCSATSAPTTVTVNPNPTASITAGGPTTFCTGGSVTLTASSGASYLWSTGATTQSIAASSSGNYSVTVTNADGCSATSASTTVTVNPNPTASITAGGPTTFCIGGSVTLTASSGASYLWSTGATTSSITVSAGGNYTVNVTNANGCSATSAPTTVTVRARPTAVVSGGGAICPGGSTTITATLTGTAPWSVTWSDGNIQTINSGTTAARSVSPASTTTYTVTTLSDANCSGTSSGSALVTVKPLPTAAVSGGGTICPGASATISAALTGTAPWSVTWSDGNIQTVNSGTTATRSVSPASTTVYTVTSVSDAKSCPRAGTGSATVTVNAAASITTQPVNKTTTRNTSVTLSVVAAGTAPISYQWFKGNGTIISGATSSSYTTSFPNKGTNTFYVEVWNACNTTHVRSTTVTVTVN